MKVLVGIKRVVDHNVRVRAKTDGSGVDIAAVKMSINPFDENAVEEAVQKIGRELHSQYWVSYRPNNLKGEEFHSIEVKVSRPGVKVRARPGYLHVPSAGDVTDPEKLPKP